MSKRILLVDDHDVVRQGIRLILRGRADWQVIGEAENGLEAVEKTKAENPDLVILDISMPGKDGIDVLRDLAEIGTDSKVLVLTMHDSKELASRLERLGASGYVIKTKAARDLIPAMRTIFEGGTYFTA